MQNKKEDSADLLTGPGAEPRSLGPCQSSRVLQISEVESWDEAQCRAGLQTYIEDTAVALKNASLILRVMVERKYDVSTLPRTWVRTMLKIAKGQMLPEVMRDFDGLARLCMSRMPIAIQRKLCENPTVQVLTEFGKVRTEKIQNLSARELRLAFDVDSLRSIKQQRMLLSANDHKLEPQPELGTYEEAMQHFVESKRRFGHLKELASLYSMIDMLAARNKRVK